MHSQLLSDRAGPLEEAWLLPKPVCLQGEFRRELFEVLMRNGTRPKQKTLRGPPASLQGTKPPECGS